MKAAVYMRVSTAAQDTANQLQGCLELCRRNGWEPIIIEETASGRKVRRPGWDQVVLLAMKGEIAAVVVWALDRIGRSLNEVYETIKGIDALGVRLLSTREPWLDVGADANSGPRDPMRMLLIMIMAWVAQFERERLLARSKEGTDQARREGRVGGRKRTALTGENLVAAVDMHRQGMSATQIQRALFDMGVHRPIRPGSRAKPQPLPRSTIHYALQRLLLFDGLTPDDPKAVEP